MAPNIGDHLTTTLRGDRFDHRRGLIFQRGLHLFHRAGIQ
jgi:hypothetical protein